MKQIVSCTAVLVVTAGLTVGLVGSANAGVLKSAPLYASGNDKVRCAGVNVGTTPLAAMGVAIVGEKGGVGLNVCYDIPPGGMCSTSVEAPEGGFCSLVFSGPSKNVRGSICIVDLDGNAKAALPTQ